MANDSDVCGAVGARLSEALGNINRRRFLQALVAMGASVALPGPLEKSGRSCHRLSGPKVASVALHACTRVRALKVPRNQPAFGPWFLISVSSAEARVITASWCGCNS